MANGRPLTYGEFTKLQYKERGGSVSSRSYEDPHLLNEMRKIMQRGTQEARDAGISVSHNYSPQPWGTMRYGGEHMPSQGHWSATTVPDKRGQKSFAINTPATRSLANALVAAEELEHAKQLQRYGVGPLVDPKARLLEERRAKAAAQQRVGGRLTPDVQDWQDFSMRSYEEGLADYKNTGGQTMDEAGPTQNWSDIASTAATLAAGFVPGVGEAIDAHNAYQSYQQGDYLGAGISGVAAAVGVLPGLGDLAATGLRAANIARKANLAKDVGLTALAAPELVSDISAKLSATEPPPVIDVTPTTPTPEEIASGWDTGPTFDDDQGGFGVGGGTTFGEQVAAEKEVSLDAFGGTGSPASGGFSQQQDDSDNNDHYAGGSWNSAEQIQAEADVGLDAFGGSGDDSGGGGGGGK